MVIEENTHSIFKVVLQITTNTTKNKAVGEDLHCFSDIDLPINWRYSFDIIAVCEIGQQLHTQTSSPNRIHLPFVILLHGVLEDIVGILCPDIVDINWCITPCIS